MLYSSDCIIVYYISVKYVEGKGKNTSIALCTEMLICACVFRHCI